VAERRGKEVLLKLPARCCREYALEWRVDG